jgi:predicted transcriptional regulator
MALSPTDVKFLLRLLEHPPQYRCRISQIKPNAKTSASERDKACKNLCSQGLVDYEEEIVSYGITAAGQSLLNLDTSILPVTPDELILLKVAATKRATPGTASKVPANSRQRLLRQLVDRGMVKIHKTQIKEVWLTAQGKTFLCQEFTPKGTATLTAAMVGTYVTFLRQSLGTRQGTKPPSPGEPLADAAQVTPEAVLEMIQQLDQQLGTDNYLPIFHLRDQLQPPLSREDLDQRLYALERSDRIELGTLQDVAAYSEAQLNAGIPQDIGGPLFFISVMQ